MHLSIPSSTTNCRARVKALKPVFALLTIIITLCSASLAYASDETTHTEQTTPRSPTGEGWHYCSKENAYCSFSGRHEVAYGQNNTFLYQTHSNGISCKARIFNTVSSENTNHCWIRTFNTPKSISIEAWNPQQKITLLGGDMVRSAQFLNEASNAQQIADWFYKDINFDYARVSYDRQQEPIEGNPNLSVYEPTISALKLIKNARPSVKFWATLKSDYDGQGSENNLPNWIYSGDGYDGGEYQPWFLNDEKYARFLADYLKYMAEHEVPISILTVSKEWVSVVNANHERLVIEALKALLSTGSYANVPMPEFAAPSSWSVAEAINFVDDALALDSLSLYSGVSTHSYDSPSDTQWADLITTSNENGKAVWHTESHSGSEGAYSGSEPPIQNQIKAFADHANWYRQGLQGELFFENWSRGIDTESKAVYFTKGSAGIRLRAYYLIKQFANYAAAAQYLPTKKTSLRGIKTMSFEKNGKLIVWVINPTKSAVSNVTLYLNGRVATNSTVDRLTWSAISLESGDSSKITLDSNYSVVSDIEAESISTYVFDVE